MKRVLLITCLWFVACNEPFSNEDIRFLKAIPREDQVEIAVPGETGTSTSGLGSKAQYYADAKRTSESLNEAPRAVLRIVQEVVKYPPTQRDEAQQLRLWGPFRDDGLEYVIVLKLVSTATIVKTTSTSTPTEVQEHYEYAMSARRPGTEEWKGLFGGAFAPGDSADTGMGAVFLNFENIHELQGKPERGTAYIGYDDRFGQQTIEIGLDVDVDPNMPLARVNVGYHYERRADDVKLFGFFVRKDIPEILPDTMLENHFIFVRWLPDNSGRADVGVYGGDLGAQTFWAVQCWDVEFNSTFLLGTIPGTIAMGAIDGCPEEFRRSPFER